MIQGQEDSDIQVFDFSTITLTSAPVIGTPPTATGVGNCVAKPDGEYWRTVILNGFNSMTFNNGTIQCTGGIAIEVDADSFGGSTLSINNTLFQNNVTGIYAPGGTTTITNSTFKFNFMAIQRDSQGTVDLSGGGNTVVCSSSLEDTTGSGNEGVGVYNTSVVNLAADNVAWDTSGPDYFGCSGLSPTDTCLCAIASCSATAPFNGMDAVTNNGILNSTITTTNNTLSTISCN